MDAILNDKEEVKKVINKFLQIIDHLDIITKAEVISKISESIKREQSKESSYYFYPANTDRSDYSKEERIKHFMDAFGGWDSEESADEIIENIRNSRHFREREVDL